MALNYWGSREKVERQFAEFKQAADAADFEIYAALKSYNLGENKAAALDDAGWAIGQAKKTGVDFWLILRAEKGHKVSDEQVRKLIAGFNNLSHFIRSYRSAHGSTPGGQGGGDEPDRRRTADSASEVAPPFFPFLGLLSPEQI